MTMPANKYYEMKNWISLHGNVCFYEMNKLNYNDMSMTVFDSVLVSYAPILLNNTFSIALYIL